eukprot:jgi/Bigna1/137244/aug1.38_g11952
MIDITLRVRSHWVMMKMKPPKEKADVVALSTKVAALTSEQVRAKETLKKLKLPPSQHEFNVRVPNGTTIEQCETVKSNQHIGIFFFEESVWDGEKKVLSGSSSDESEI